MHDQNPPLSTPSGGEALSSLLSQLMALMHRKVTGETLSIMHEAGLTLPQMVAMHALKHAGAQSVGGLAEQLNLSTSAASHMVERLVERGFVERTEDPEDRRQKRVALAAGGEALLEQLWRSRNEEVAQIAARLDPGTLEAVLRLLEETIQHLKKSQ